MQQRSPETAGGGVAAPAREAQAPRDVCSCTVVCQSSSTAPLQRRAFATPGDALCFAQAVAESGDAQPLWVDAQGWANEDKQRALRFLFPEMQPSHADAVLASDLCDVAELQAWRGEYVVGCLACSRDRGGPFLSSAPTEAAVDSDDVVLCSFACDERRLLTFHGSAFVGLSEALRRAECDCPAANASSHSEGAKTLSAAALLCALVCFTCEARLPDTTPLVTEVDCIDEMMMLVAPGKSDQTDMLRRVALLRRRLSSTTRQLRAKEGLLQELVGPTMRTSFVSRDASVISSYREAFDELWPVLECLECASDAVNHASLNFTYAISMRKSQASAGFDYQMMIINKIVTVCLPANLLCSLFGMNCRVAWQADERDDLRAFWGIIGLISLWLAVCLFRPVRDFLRWRGG